MLVYSYYNHFFFFTAVQKSGKPSLKRKKRNFSYRMLKMENSGEFIQASRHIIMFLRVRDSVGFGSDQLENKVLTQTGMSWSRLQY